MANARELVLKGLCRIEEKGEYSNIALAYVLERDDLSPVDRAFVTELMMGVVRNRLKLDYIVQKFSKIKLKKLSPKVHQMLRMGIYQMVCMDNIPDSAACNETVKLANKYAHGGAKGYVNGLLRSVSREKENIEYPTDDLNRLSIYYSCPLWLTEKLICQYGADECEKILADSHIKHPPAIRVNRTKITENELIKVLDDEGIKVKETDIENCLLVDGAINVKKSKAYLDGLYTLQGISSMMAVDVLAPEANEFVMDMCAAPGGKTTQIAEIMGDKGKVLAFDIHPHKIDLINSAAKRLGLSSVEAKLGNSAVFMEEYDRKADRVLVDAPCSGIGIIHKKPDIKWQREEKDIEQLVKIQRDILENSSKYVKSGGVLVYSTCTILKEENQEQVQKFLENNTDFELKEEQQIQTYQKGGNGFYIAKMIRK